MWVKNTRTNKKWFVPFEQGKRLLKDKDYESAEPSADSAVNLAELTVEALRKRAADKAVPGYQSLNKDALIKALNGDQTDDQAVTEANSQDSVDQQPAESPAK